MKVGVDTFGLEHGRNGYGVYLKSLFRAIDKSSNIEWVLFGSEVDRYIFNQDNKFTYVSLEEPRGRGARWLWSRFKANAFYKAQGFDAVLYPAATVRGVLHSRALSIALVSGVPRERYVLHTLRHAKAVIATSDYIKKALVSSFVNAKKIFLISSATDHKVFYPVAVEEEVESVNINPFAIKRPYFIYATTIQNHDKKHIELIRAFNLFKRRTNAPHRLVISGAIGDGAEAALYMKEVEIEAFNSPFAQDIFLTGYFEHESLPYLYRGAAAVLFPAVSEGTGLGVMEAIASGIPVALSDRGALKEVSGGNAIFFNSDDIEGIAIAMGQLISSDDEYKSERIDKGIKWAARFSWERTAKEFCDRVQKILERKRGQDKCS